MSTLLIKDGPLSGKRITVSSEMSLGREGADITIEDSEISRRHALLRPSGDGVEVEDAGSTNGTYVNGNKISGATKLNPGDTVKLGQTTMEVERAPRAGETVAAPAWTPGATRASPIPQVPAAASGPPPAQAPPSQPQPQYQPPAAQPPPQYQPPPSQPQPQYPPTQPQPGYSPPGYPPTGPTGAVRPKGPKGPNRTPLFIGGAVLLIILLGLGAFFLLGGDDEPSKAEYISAADNICQDANKKANKIDVDFADPEGIEKGFNQIVGISEDMLGDLKGLDRPAEDQETLDDFFAAFEDVNKELKGFAPILRDGELDAINKASTRLQKDAKRLDDAAKDFGFKDCRDTAEV